MSEITTHLIVDAGHPAVRIEVLDSGYRLRASGYGRIEGDLPTGFYTVQYKAADAIQSLDFSLRPGEPLTLSESPDLPFSSAAPLELTSTSHEYHQSHAQRLSTSTPLELGSGSQVFVFVRDVERGGRTHPAKDLSLHRLNGEPVVQFDEVIESSRSRDEARWGGCNIAVDPGYYRLRLALPKGKAIEMILPASPGWQSQVFLLRQGGESAVGGRPVLDLANATQMMARPGLGFNPWNYQSTQKRLHSLEAGEDLRLVELARQALARGYRGIGSSDLDAMLRGKWEDPLLGIMGLHLLLQLPEPDLSTADEVLGRLRGSILHDFHHPDIDAIALEIARLRGQEPDLGPIEAPPMLRQSWNILVRASAEQPGLIPPDALAFQVADRLWGASAWLIWEAPSEAAISQPETSWMESYIQSSRPEIQDSIVELDDRVIISGVTLYKRDASRETEAMPQVEPESARAALGTTRAEPETTNAEPETEGAEPEAENKEPAPAPAEQAQAAPPETSVDLADFTAVQTALIELLPKWEQLAEKKGPAKLIKQAQLSDTEYALLVQLQGARNTQQYSFITSRDPVSFENLVRQLGIPAEMVREAQNKLYGKLLVTLAEAPEGATQKALK
jgi:hypothetical protein